MTLRTTVTRGCAPPALSRMGLVVLLVTGCLLASAVANTRPPSSVVSAGVGNGNLPPTALSPPGTLIPIDPNTRHILAMVTIVRPEDTVVLRSPHHHGRVVLPTERTADGAFLFAVPAGTEWLLTVTSSDVVDVPIAAGQDIRIALP